MSLFASVTNYFYILQVGLGSRGYGGTGRAIRVSTAPCRRNFLMMISLVPRYSMSGQCPLRRTDQSALKM